MAQLAARRSHNPKVASSILAGSMFFFFFPPESCPCSCNGLLSSCATTLGGTRLPSSFTQGSVQIELIFRLLLKITVDWPYNAIIKCL